MTSQQKDLVENKQSESSWWQKTRENVQIIVIALILAFVIRAFVAEPRFIPSDSMLPTLETGDRLVVEKVSYHFHPPTRGDIVVFHPPEQLLLQGYNFDQAFIKRIMATANQTIAVNNGIVYLDNQPLLEDYIFASPKYNLAPVTVPVGSIFVMGDNRNNSNDSHIWGFLPEKNIIGHAVFRFWPLNRLGQLDELPKNE